MSTPIDKKNIAWRPYMEAVTLLAIVSVGVPAFVLTAFFGWPK